MIPPRAAAAPLLLTLALVSMALAAPAKIGGTALVYLRSGPGTSNPPLGVLKAGDAIEALETVGFWTKIRTSGGEVGFVRTSFVVPAEAAGAGSAAAATVTAAAEAPPTPAEPESAERRLSAEVADLRQEIADLKRQIAERPAEPVENQAGRRSVPPETSPTAALGFDPAASSPPASEPKVRVLAVALISLVVGWVVGSTFTRRRSRNQRSRLRF